MHKDLVHFDWKTTCFCWQWPPGGYPTILCKFSINGNGGQVREYFNFLLPHNSLNFTIILTKILFILEFSKLFRTQNSLLQQLGPLPALLLNSKRFIRIRIWSIWTARQPASVGNGYQDDIPLADANDEAEADADVDAEADADATNRQQPCNCERGSEHLTSKYVVFLFRLYCNSPSAPLCNFINFYWS